VYNGGRSGQSPNAQNWHGYWCAIQNIDPSTFAACAYPPQPESPSP
jgi:hypothetical protein